MLLKIKLLSRIFFKSLRGLFAEDFLKTKLYGNLDINVLSKTLSIAF